MTGAADGLVCPFLLRPDAATGLQGIRKRQLRFDNPEQIPGSGQVRKAEVDEGDPFINVDQVKRAAVVESEVNGVESIRGIDIYVRDIRIEGTVEARGEVGVRGIRT